MSFKKETKSTLLLLLIIGVSAVIIYIFALGLDYLSMQGKHTWVFYFIGYIIALFFTNWLKNKIQWKFFKIIDFIVSIPFLLLGLLFHFIVPTMAIIFNTIIFVSFSLILPLLFFQLNDFFNLFSLEEKIKPFIYLTFSTCFSVALFDQLLTLIFKIGPFKSDKYERYNLKELTGYILNKENVRFMIYTLFFIYLVMLSIQNLQGTSVFEVVEKDKAIYQSFLCFLAFDRLLLNSNRFILLPSVLLKKIISSLTNESDRD